MLVVINVGGAQSMSWGELIFWRAFLSWRPFVGHGFSVFTLNSAPAATALFMLASNPGWVQLPSTEQSLLPKDL